MDIVGSVRRSMSLSLLRNAGAVIAAKFGELKQAATRITQDMLVKNEIVLNRRGRRASHYFGRRNWRRWLGKTGNSGNKLIRKAMSHALNKRPMTDLEKRYAVVELKRTLAIRVKKAQRRAMVPA